MTIPQPLRGAVVRAYRFVGVALAAADEGILAIPAINPEQRGAYRHRADIAHAEWLLPSDTMLRAGDPEIVRSRVTIIGHVSAETLAQIEAAMRREMRAVAAGL